MKSLYSPSSFPVYIKRSWNLGIQSGNWSIFLVRYQPIALFQTTVGTGYPSAWQCNIKSLPAETLISLGSTTQCGGTES